MKYSVVKMFNVCLVGLERKVMAAFLLGVDSLRGLTGDGSYCASSGSKVRQRYMYQVVCRYAYTSQSKL